MPLLNINIPLTPVQREIAESKKRVKIVIAGRRQGKSYLLKTLLTSNANQHPNKNSVLLMPVRKQSEKFFQTMVKAKNYRLLLREEPKVWPYCQMIFHNGHVLDFDSFQNEDGLRGEGLTFAGVDEANFLDGEKVTGVLIPKLADTDGSIFVSSTITHHNWLWDLYLKGQNPDDKLFQSWLLPTHTGICFQGEKGQERLEFLKSSMPQWQYESECLCIPGKDNSAVFPYVGECIKGEAPAHAAGSGTYLMGLDLARKNDHTAYVIVDAETRQAVQEFEYESGTKHEKIAHDILNVSNHWNNCRVVIDATGGGGSGGIRGRDDSYVHVYEDAFGDDADRIEPFYWSPNNNSGTKEDVISYLALLTEQGKVSIPGTLRKLVYQMKNYAIKVNRLGGRSFGPRSGNDDLVTAFASAIWGIKKEWFDDSGTTERSTTSDSGSIGMF